MNNYSVKAYCSICRALIFSVDGPVSEEERLHIELNAPKTVFCLNVEHNTEAQLNFNYALEWYEIHADKPNAE